MITKKESERLKKRRESIQTSIGGVKKLKDLKTGGKIKGLGLVTKVIRRGYITKLTLEDENVAIPDIVLERVNKFGPEVGDTLFVSLKKTDLECGIIDYNQRNIVESRPLKMIKTIIKDKRKITQQKELEKKIMEIYNLMKLKSISNLVSIAQLEKKISTPNFEEGLRSLIKKQHLALGMDSRKLGESLGHSFKNPESKKIETKLL